MLHETYPEIFYPSLTEPSQATPLNIKPGEDLTGIDFRLAKVPAYHIRGSGMSDWTRLATGRGRGDASMVRREYGDDAATVDFKWPRSQADGTFDVLDAVPGSYVISSGQPGNPNMPYGTVTVEVRDRDIDNVSIPVAPGFDLNGGCHHRRHLPSEHAADAEHLVLRNPRTTPTRRPMVGADLTISMKNVFSVPYLINPPMLQYLYIKSMHLGSQDVSDGTGNACPYACCC